MKALQTFRFTGPQKGGDWDGIPISTIKVGREIVSLLIPTTEEEEAKLLRDVENAEMPFITLYKEDEVRAAAEKPKEVRVNVPVKHKILDGFTEDELVRMEKFFTDDDYADITANVREILKEAEANGRSTESPGDGNTDETGKKDAPKAFSEMGMPELKAELALRPHLKAAGNISKAKLAEMLTEDDKKNAEAEKAAIKAQE